MVTTPLEAEAIGQEFIEADYRGHTFRVPVDVDSWPLASVRLSCLVDPKSQKLRVNHSAVSIALQWLLGDQWDEFLRVAPKRKHWVPATQVFADAVGIPARSDADQVFGALPWLLAVLDRWPEKVESDLDQFWGIDYGHRFLFQSGRRRLTLRKIHARLTNLPVDSALAIAMNDGKLHRSGVELVLMDLYRVWTGKDHPSRPRSAEEVAAALAVAAQEEKARTEHRARQEKRDRRLSGAENAKANARRAQREREAHAQEV